MSDSWKDCWHELCVRINLCSDLNLKPPQVIIFTFWIVSPTLDQVVARLNGFGWLRHCLMGSSTKKFLLHKSHILDSNGVWYSWFWPPQTQFCLQEPQLATQGTSTHSTIDLSQGSIAPRVKVSCFRVKVPCDAASLGPMWHRELRSLVTKFKQIFFSFGPF